MAPPRSHQIWTDEDLEYLAERWGTIPTDGIADHLGRSTEAVQLKASELGLGATLQAGDYVTLHALLREILGGGGYNLDLKAKRLIAHGLPYRVQRIVEAEVRVVSLDKFWTWAEKHKKLMDFAWFEENGLGKEPEWVKSKRRADTLANAICPRYSRWTQEDESRLAMLLRQRKYTMAQISEKMHRSAESIRHKCERLGLPPPVAEPKFLRAWLPEDDAGLEADIRALTPWPIIGLALGRNTEAAKKRARRLYGTSDQDAIRAILAERDALAVEAEEKKEGEGCHTDTDPHPRKINTDGTKRPIAGPQASPC